MRMFIAGLVATLLLASIPSTLAQDQANPTLSIELPAIDEEGRIGVAPNPSNITFAWAYSFPSQSSPPSGQTSITWSVGCGEGDVHLVSPNTTAITFTPATGRYAGTATIGIEADKATPGVVDLNCTLSGVVAASGVIPESRGTRNFTPQVAFYSELKVEVPQKLKQAGPQKIIPYPITVTNLGNSKTTINFREVSSPEEKRWAILLPDPLVLEPGEVKTTTVSVATPYRNGFNNVEGQYVIQLVPSSAQDEEQKGEAQDVHFGARARGWYMPGPSPVLLIGLVGLLALLHRRNSN